MPLCAALLANLAPSFAAEHASIKSGATKHIGAAKLKTFRHIIPSWFPGDLSGNLFRFGTVLADRMLSNRTRAHDLPQHSDLLRNADAQGSGDGDTGGLARPCTAD